MTKANGLEVSKVAPGLYVMESVMMSECRHEDDQVSDHPMMMTPSLCPHSGEAVITLRPAECQA